SVNSFGFGGNDTPSWLPQPTTWGTYAVDRQDRDTESTLQLYRAALRLRSLFVAAGDEMEISRENDLLFIHRGNSVAVVNFGWETADLPNSFGPNHTPLLALTPVLSSRSGALSAASGAGIPPQAGASANESRVPTSGSAPTAAPQGPWRLAENSAVWLVRAVEQPLT
ncbi:MAG: hypothetical protein ACO3KZ_05955, partial [Ilumatobacteraceae bacterium]